MSDRAADGRPGALRVEGLHKSFGHLEVLRGIDLTVAEHEVVCLIGASGSGKSTLLRCVDLLEPVDAGRIFLGAEEPAASVALSDEQARRFGAALARRVLQAGGTRGGGSRCRRAGDRLGDAARRFAAAGRTIAELELGARPG